MVENKDWRTTLLELPYLSDRFRVGKTMVGIHACRQEGDGTVSAEIAGSAESAGTDKNGNRLEPPVYEVTLDPAGPLSSSCDCQEFTAWRQGTTVCKHIAALACHIDGTLLVELPETADPMPRRPEKAQGRGVEDREEEEATEKEDKRPAPPASSPVHRPGRGGGRPATVALVRACVERNDVPVSPAALPECDPVHELGRPGRRKEQEKQFYALLRTGAFTCGDAPEGSGAAMGIREAVVRCRLLGRADYAQVALMWCAWREPGKDNHELLLGLAETVGRPCVKALRKWFVEIR